MAEQTFRSPGFFDQEIDLSGGSAQVTGIPAGVVGTSEKGPAFVPVTVGSIADFETRFGSLDPKKFGPYAVQKWLEHRTACTYVRVLGAGANETAVQIGNTRNAGIVSNAGFRLSGSKAEDTSKFTSSEGTTQFIVARHNAVADEAHGFPIFTDNASINDTNAINLLRGVVFLASGTRMLLADNDAGYSAARGAVKVGNINGSALTEQKYFKIVLSSSAGDGFGSDEDFAGIRLLTASLDPNDGAYIGKVLNTNPLRFQQEQHLLYSDFAVEHDLAPVIQSGSFRGVSVLSGSDLISANDPLSNAYETLFGRFDTRYTTPRTTSFISQPYGTAEYDLFHFETIDDGVYANEKFKISVAGLKASTNEKQPYGSFEVQVRSFDDSDGNSAILERYPNCSLDPNSDRYIARLVGDKKVRFDFDQEDPDERRLVVTGKYPNVSSRVRIVMKAQVTDEQVPKDSLPFGFRGIPALKTTNTLTDGGSALTFGGKAFGQSGSIDRLSRGPGLEGQAASVTITATNGPTSGKQLIIITTDGTSKTFQAAASTDGTATTALFNRNGSSHGFADLKTAIEASSIAAKVTVGSPAGSDPYTMVITQNTSGIDGERAIVSNVDNYNIGGAGSATDGAFTGGSDAGTHLTITGAIAPPLPYRVKVTRGAVKTDGTYLGEPGDDERVDGRFYWGVKCSPMPVSSSTDSVLGISNAALNTNIGAGINPLVRAYTRFQGIEKLDALVTGSGKDAFNNNKFTLARVALRQQASTLAAAVTAVTGTASEHMLQAAYVRNGEPDSTTYTVGDGAMSTRVTLATLHATSSALFNRFTGFAKYTNIFYGGFNGVNILDTDMSFFRDRSLSADAGGKNVESAASQNIGLNLNPSGNGRRNNQVASYRKGIEIITNPVTSRINLLAVPGVRDSYVTDHAADQTKAYNLAMYVMDIPEYDKNSNRLYDDSSERSNVAKTIDQFESRAIDNNYVATYFPNVNIDDNVNNRVVEVPPSIAALGALGFNDKNQEVWFAPAGFNRGSLGFVNNVENRLSSNDRDDLYDSRINPIATFPRAGFVIFGQKTLQVAQSALDRINVRRMLLDVKRRVGGIAQRLVFEQNNSSTRAKFVADTVQQLTIVQAGQGIEAFKVVCDETNNTTADIEQNRLRGTIQVVPTRAVEFISVDFIITNSGVTFA